MTMQIKTAELESEIVLKWKLLEEPEAAKKNHFQIHTVNTIVTDSNRANLSLIVSFNQSLPSAFSGLSASIWSMKKHEINISKPGLFKSLLYLSQSVLIAESASWNFAGEENVFTFESRVNNSFSTWCFITICSCRIHLQKHVRDFEIHLLGLNSRVYSQSSEHAGRLLRKCLLGYTFMLMTRISRLRLIMPTFATHLITISTWKARRRGDNYRIPTVGYRSHY